jgi:DNA-binding protein
MSKEGGKHRKWEGNVTAVGGITTNSSISSSKTSGGKPSGGGGVAVVGTTSAGMMGTKMVALPNEIRITQHGKPRNYITYAMNMLASESTNEIILKGMGRAMNKTVMIAEILKRKVSLHQITSVESLFMEEQQQQQQHREQTQQLMGGATREEIEAQLRCYKSSMTVILSKVPLDSNNKGYQPPLPTEDMLPAGDIRPGLSLVVSTATATGGPTLGLR